MENYGNAMRIFVI